MNLQAKLFAIKADLGQQEHKMLTRDSLDFHRVARLTAIEAGMKAYHTWEHKIMRHDYMVVINYREPSWRKRLYVVNLESNEVIRNHHVAHGKNSASDRSAAYCDKFSNNWMSKQTSLGAMITGEIYNGKHGKSLKLHGLEKGVNDNVYRRGIIIHGASYVSNSYILKNGRCGLSWGCPAVDNYVVKDLIELVKGGCLVYAFY